jgi:hypothetical protein
MRQVSDSYDAIDGVLYELQDGHSIDQEEPNGARLRAMAGAPVVNEVNFEDLPAGSSASRCATARWSDGTEDDAAPLVCRRGPLLRRQPRRQDTRGDPRSERSPRP